MQDYTVDEDSSRVEEILGTMTGDYTGKVRNPASRVEVLLARLKAKLDELEGRVVKLKCITFKKVSTLPEEGDENTVYLIAHEHSEGSRDFFDEYFYVGDQFELIGNTDIDLTEYVKTVDLSKVATSGSYNDLSDTPKIPSKVSELENDSSYATTKDVKDVSDKLTPDTTYTLEQDKTNTQKLIFTDSNGNKTEIITKDTIYDDTVLKEELSKKAASSDLSKVATSGSYNDLKDVPDLATKDDVTKSLESETKIEEEKKDLVKQVPDIISTELSDIPDNPDNSKIYLTKQSDGSYYINRYNPSTDKFEQWGSVDIDLSKYSKFEAMTILLYKMIFG